MFARKIHVQYLSADEKRDCPLKWLDNFSMRNFTNDPIFDDTLPIGDGSMEIGKNVPLPRLKAAMEDWFHRKGYLPKDSELLLSE